MDCRLRLFVFALCLSAANAYNYYMASHYIDLSNNLALSKGSYQSTTHDRGYASLGNDGGVSGNWWDYTCMHTQWKPVSWWTVDLGEEHNDTQIKVVKLFNRLDMNSEYLQGVEIRVGNKKVSADGDGLENPLCNHTSSTEFVYSHPGETPYYPTLFRCDNSVGRYVTVRLATGKALSFCEAMVFSEEKGDQYIMKPDVKDGCPKPLEDACVPLEGETQDHAYIRAFMEGPPKCDDKGFFCRILQDPAGRGGMTGGPGDDFVGNENFGYCVDRATDRQIDWNNLGRQPINDDGHCHGSEFDDMYIGVLYDHYYRPYRGTLECCCGIEKRDESDDWAPAKNFISRCDYRGRNGNNAAENYENGCGSDMAAFYEPDEFPDKENMCWTMQNFGMPYDYLYGEVAPYKKPDVDVPYCQGGEDNAWAGCLIRVDEKSYGSAIVLISPEKTEPRMIDDIEACDEIYDVQVSEVSLEKFKMDSLDIHGHETDFLRLLRIPAGQTAYIQVMDRQRCTISDLIEVTVPNGDGLVAEAPGRKKMRRLLIA